jgi:hypothetical protein
MVRSNVRLVTVNATGDRYIVQQALNGNAGWFFYCWGEVHSIRGASTKHGPSRAFRKEDVTVAEVEKTPGLLLELFEQYLKNFQAAGGEFVGRGRTLRITRYPTVNI